MIVKKWLTVIQVLLILIFLCCTAYVGKYFYDAYTAQREYDILSDEVKRNTHEDAEGNYREKYADNGMLMSYYDLYQKNNDMVGWIKIKDTSIDYPVVQSKDNDYYLQRDFHKNKQYSGIPFIDCDTTPDSANKIIYAHNMKNGTMFADVTKYADEEYYKNHRFINYDTLYERGKYEIISVFRTDIKANDGFHYQNYADITAHDVFNDYIRRVKALSIHKIDISAEYGDSLITLSTCNSRSSGKRIVLVAKRIE